MSAVPELKQKKIARDAAAAKSAAAAKVEAEKVIFIHNNIYEYMYMYVLCFL